MSVAHPAPQPSLLAIRAFEAAGRLGSFTRAGHELGLTQSAISRHVHALEQCFGQSLFERNGRFIALTRAGTAYLSDLSIGLERIREANLRMTSRKRPGNRVTVSMLPSVAALWLAPHLHEFTETNPDIDLRIHASRSIVDFERDEIDLAIRYGLGNWPGSRAELLARETLTPVCSPAFADRHGLNKVPEKLLGLPLLLDDIPNGWDEWFRAVHLDPARAKFGASFDEGSSLYGAALAGAGVALGRGLLVRNHLAEGRLVAPFEHSIDASYAYWLVGPAKLPAMRAASRFIRWLQSLDDVAEGEREIV